MYYIMVHPQSIFARYFNNNWNRSIAISIHMGPPRNCERNLGGLFFTKNYKNEK